jgi:hypothetical protein
VIKGEIAAVLADDELGTAERARVVATLSGVALRAIESGDPAGRLDRLEEHCFRPVQIAYGRAKRGHTEFAGRHGLQPAVFEQQPTGLPSQGAAAFIERAVEAVGAADRMLVGLQDSMLPVDAGDQELRAGLKSIREPLGSLPAKARQFLRGLGR